MLKLRIIWISAAALAISACTITGVLDNAYQNREYIGETAKRPFTVADARGTFLLKSATVFYPKGVPDDPTVLSDLSETEKAGIEHLLKLELTRIATTEVNHHNILAKQFAHFDGTRGHAELTVLKQGTAVAATDQSGRMYIDAKVIQAIYRSALLTVLVEEGDNATDKERERLAFARFAELRQKLDRMSPSQPLSDARNFKEAYRSSTDHGMDKVFAGLFGVLQGKLDDMVVAGQSESLERTFLGAIDFLAAHETGHLVLGHFPVTNDCIEAQQHELEADRFALLVTGFSTFDRLPHLNVKEQGLGWEGDSSLLTIQLTMPDSYESFFRHAYGLAGFDNVMANAPNCNYPSPEERRKALAPVSSLVQKMVWYAKWAQATVNWKNKRDGNLDFDTYFKLVVDNKDERGSLTANTINENRGVMHDFFYEYLSK